MGFFDFLSGLSPGTAAGQAGAEALSGIFNGVTKVIEEFHLPPEQEMQLKVKLSKLQFQTYNAQLTDTASARQMQMATKSWWPGIISFVTLVGFFGSGWYIIHWGIPATSADGRDIIIQWAQTLYMGIGLVYGYWLGSSHTEQIKRNTASKTEG